MDFICRVHDLPVIEPVRGEHLSDVSGENDAVGDKKCRGFQVEGSKSLGGQKNLLALVWR